MKSDSSAHVRTISLLYKNIWLLGLFVVILVFLYLVDILDLNPFLASVIFIVLFSLAYYIISYKQIKKADHYQSLIEFLDIDEDEDFESRNLFAHSLIYPPNFSDEHYEVFSKSRPVTYLGGDLYYHAKDSNNYYWFAIGDTSGHDINSHLFSMMLISNLAYFINLCKNPKEVNQNINSDLKQRVVFSKFLLPYYASLVILRGDSKGNIKHYGQHPNMVLFRDKTQSIEIIETIGEFIGIEKFSNLRTQEEDREFQLFSGDLLFIFTDGIFEQKNKENKYFGYRLYEFIQNHPKEDIGKLIENLFKEVESFTHGKIQDDMTIMVIRKK